MLFVFSVLLNYGRRPPCHRSMRWTRVVYYIFNTQRRMRRISSAGIFFSIYYHERKGKRRKKKPRLANDIEWLTMRPMTMHYWLTRRPDDCNGWGNPMGRDYSVRPSVSNLFKMEEISIKDLIWYNRHERASVYWCYANSICSSCCVCVPPLILWGGGIRVVLCHINSPMCHAAWEHWEYELIDRFSSPVLCVSISFHTTWHESETRYSSGPPTKPLTAAVAPLVYRIRARVCLFIDFANSTK